ncbi:MAG: GntR family transcriptional regulator [Polyangiaceae bacterium]
MFRPVEKKSLATSVFEQLRDHIVRGEARPGDALPSERVLSEKLKVNRGAVREGLRRLEQAGLVAVSQGGATQVLDFTRTAGLELLGALVVREGRVDTRVARSILELRSALGPEVARACARRRATGALPKIVAEMRAANGDAKRLSELAMSFWAEVVRGADGLAWQLAFNSLRASYGLVEEHLAEVMLEEHASTAEYARLADVIAAGDEAAAAKVAGALVVRGQRAFAHVLDAIDREDGEGSARATKEKGSTAKRVTKAGAAVAAKKGRGR